MKFLFWVKDLMKRSTQRRWMICRTQSINLFDSRIWTRAFTLKKCFWEDLSPGWDFMMRQKSFLFSPKPYPSPPLIIPFDSHRIPKKSCHKARMKMLLSFFFSPNAFLSLGKVICFWQYFRIKNVGEGKLTQGPIAISLFILCRNTKTQLWFYASSITRNKASSQLLFYCRSVKAGGDTKQAFIHIKSWKRQKFTINLLSSSTTSRNCLLKRYKIFPLETHSSFPFRQSPSISKFNNVFNWQWHNKTLKLLKQGKRFQDKGKRIFVFIGRWRLLFSQWSWVVSHNKNHITPLMIFFSVSQQKLSGNSM